MTNFFLIILMMMVIQSINQSIDDDYNTIWGSCIDNQLKLFIRSTKSTKSIHYRTHISNICRRRMVWQYFFYWINDWVKFKYWKQQLLEWMFQIIGNFHSFVFLFVFSEMKRLTIITIKSQQIVKTTSHHNNNKKLLCRIKL